jgi:hypothetical protein
MQKITGALIHPVFRTWRNGSSGVKEKTHMVHSFFLTRLAWLGYYADQMVGREKWSSTRILMPKKGKRM